MSCSLANRLRRASLASSCSLLVRKPEEIHGRGEGCQFEREGGLRARESARPRQKKEGKNARLFELERADPAYSFREVLLWPGRNKKAGLGVSAG